MSKEKVAILGGGDGAFMMAVDLTDRGYDVHLCEHPSFAGGFKETQERGAIEASGIGPTGVFPISMLTTSIAEVVKDVEWVHVAMCAAGHEVFFKDLVPLLRDDHKVVIWAGDFASLRLHKLIRDSGRNVTPTIFEGMTLPYGTRKVDKSHICLLLTAPRILVGALPASNSAGFASLKEQFPAVEPAQHVMAAAFSNPNPIVHPPGSLLNTGRIQYSGGDFYMYKEGITESVAMAIRAVYDESRSVALALGFDMLEYRDVDFRTRTSIMGASFDSPFDTFGIIAGIKGPTSVHARYITEDLPYGLVPRCELGRLVGVPTKVTDGFVSIGSIVCQEDYWKSGRTLATLGLDDKTPEDIIHFLENG